jgi:membrane protein YdbS with pleckstrin-like domain
MSDAAPPADAPPAGASAEPALPPDESFTPLAPRARVLFHLQALVRFVLVWLPLLSCAGAFAATELGVLRAFFGAVALLFLVFVLTVWWPSLSFDRWGYALRPEELLITSGVVFRRITAIPLSRVQHVDTRQGPIEQWFGLARLQISTASGVGSDGVIPGLDLADAERLRDRLVARAQGDDGV